MTEIFKRFNARYLHKWASAIEGIEEMAVTEWSQALAGLTAAQIKRGLDEWAGEWPPSSVEFRVACEGKKTNGFGLDYVPEYYRESRQERLLESDQLKETRKELAKTGIGKLFKVLGKK